MDYLLSRLSVYDILRRIFIEEPSVELLRFLKKINTDEIISPHFFEDRKINEFFFSSIASLKDKDISHNSSEYQDLHWDYTRLFIGPHALPASPWESSYKNDGLLFTETTAAVEAYYNKHGFYLSNSEQEAADHIGFEFDFIYHLIEKCHSAEILDPNKLKESLAVQSYFLDNHILVFIESLMTSITKHAQTDFYKNISLFSASFVKYDSEKIKSLLLEL